MTIQQCKYVLKVLEYGSFNEAAKQLFVAQSSLSVSVKTLEQELNIKIFERSLGGVYLTEEGTEFVRYARQFVELNDFVSGRYKSDSNCTHLYLATQHYDFVADIFSKLINETADPQYRFSLREMKTYDVIHETENAYCDIGIIAIKSCDTGVMERYLSKKGLVFTPFIKAMPHVFVRQGHPLAQQKRLTLGQLRDYPSLSYEQGEHCTSFFTEELIGITGDRQVEISDRASLMNVLLATDCYTIGTGIMPSLLNEGRIVSIPLSSDDYYSIGYLTRGDRTLSPLAQRFIERLHKTVEELQ